MLILEAVLGYNMTDTSNMLSHILPMAESIQRQDLLNQVQLVHACILVHYYTVDYY